MYELSPSKKKTLKILLQLSITQTRLRRNEMLGVLYAFSDLANATLQQQLVFAVSGLLASYRKWSYLMFFLPPGLFRRDRADGLNTRPVGGRRHRSM
jgi:hypothetical protein